MKNYKKIDTAYLDEIKSQVKMYEHIKSGARVLTFENADPNKVFMIGFRTPPINSCGLTHILEHSVLCGSKKYPVKDPFLELMKSSMSTFLNAFTSPDKTMYPVASQNEKDFENLMSVYCDAVFYPNVLKNEKIFRQEGWRYELFDKKAPIRINGVVYNEMKGAFSNPDDILFRQVMHGLFPESAYSYESGGDPVEIPNLSYETFVNFHKKYYVPSNSYIFLYGDTDMEKRMEFLDQEYLSHFERSDFDTRVKEQKAFDQPVEKEIFYPIGKDDSPKDKTTLSYSFVLKNGRDEKELIALRALTSVLVDNPGAPLKKALIDSGVGSSVEMGVTDELLQPFMQIVVKGSEADKKDLFKKVYRETIEKMIHGELDHRSILAQLNHAEFVTREDKGIQGFPKGLGIILASISTWAYDDSFDGAVKGLSSLPYYKELREDLEKGYFEKLLQDEFLDNPHALFLVSSPSKTVQEEKEKALEEKLAEYKASLSEEEIEDLIKSSNELRAYQAAPSTPEELATLPRLTKDDLDKEIPFPTSDVRENGKYKSYVQILPTNGIAYMYYGFDMRDLSLEEIPYVSLLRSYIGTLGTKKHGAKELSDLQLMEAGAFNMGMSNYTAAKGEYKAFASLNFSSLDDKAGTVSDLAEEVIFDTEYDDDSLLKEVIERIKAEMQGRLSYSGHVFAYKRALASKNLKAAVNEAASGIAYYDFISDLSKHFEEKKEDLKKRLVSLSKKLFAKERFFVIYTGDEETYSVFKKKAEEFYQRLSEEKEGEIPHFVSSVTKEGIKAPYDVSYVARAGILPFPSNLRYGQMIVLDNILSNDYLWMKVRVKGGAYGCFIVNRYDGDFILASYRDPKLKETDGVYQDLPEFVEKMDYDEDDLMKFKIGALGTLNPVMHVSVKGYNGFLNTYLSQKKENIDQRVEGAINATLNDLKSFAGDFRKALSDSSFAVLGKADLIEENKEMFDKIRNLD